MYLNGYLILEDGTVWRGRWEGTGDSSVGEVVFNTAMTGYQEVVTDPSYAGQIVVMTCPHIGNVGVNQQDAESSRPYLLGLVVRSLDVPSNWRAEGSLRDYLQKFNVPVLTEVDTRSLTRHLRDGGALRGGVFSHAIPEEVAWKRVKESPPMVGSDWVSSLGSQEPYRWQEEDGTAIDEMPQISANRKAEDNDPILRVAVIDCGVKWNIFRWLSRVGCELKVFPPTVEKGQIEDWSPQGVLLSNGPGDPAALKRQIRLVEQLLGHYPLFGICLGHQLLALAIGARTYKMKFGHRGINHPVGLDPQGRVWVTVHNHGFAVDEATLTSEAQVTLRSLNDGTLEGFDLPKYRAMAVQFHPEASPGPHEAGEWFWKFRRLMTEPSSLNRENHRL